MKEWTKWKVLDYRLPNRHVEVRFDEIVDLMNKGELGQSDLVCPPNEENYQFVSKCAQLQYYFVKSYYDIFHEHKTQRKYIENCFGLPVNKRTAFVQENYFFSAFFKKKKLDLLERCSSQLIKILEPLEEINYIFSATADIGLSSFFSFFFNTSRFLESFVIITNLRIIQAYWNPKTNRPESFKSIYLSNITDFQFSSSSIQSPKLEIYFYNKCLLTWLKMNPIDKVQLMPVLSGLINKNSHPATNINEVWVPNLCKSCFSKLKSDSLLCPYCDTEYKSPSRASELSALIPGLGLIYSGFKWWGITSIIGELIFLFGCFPFLISMNYPMSINFMILGMISLFLIITHQQCARTMETLVKELRPLAKGS
ncbi:MAG: hypothetical protein JW774_02020 [Candidatus Aureabacteria bacterium]|nr:hypothetical protein [Candidatus Auribacterota bacterium]